MKRRVSRQEAKLFRRYSGKSLRGEIHCGDALAFLRSQETESADVVFLDPPFNLGKQYDPRHPNGDRRSVEDYWLWMEMILSESVRILRDGGALYLYHIPLWAMRFGEHLSRRLQFRHWIAVSMKNGFARGERLYPAHYALLYFTKGEPRFFKRPRLRPVKCRHCGRTIKDYGGYKHIINAKGLNLSDVWEDLSPVRHSKTKLRAANQLPLALTKRVMAISGRKNGFLVDPFAGSGSTVVAAANAGMVFMACDIVKHNCVVIEERLRRLPSDKAP
jgi:site-specific DNA-methyltransferase (adenine-specific)